MEILEAHVFKVLKDFDQFLNFYVVKQELLDSNDSKFVQFDSVWKDFNDFTAKTLQKIVESCLSSSSIPCKSCNLPFAATNLLNNEEMKYKNGHDKTRKDDGRVTISAKVVQSEIQRSNQEL